jgi:hypothetical protein
MGLSVPTAHADDYVPYGTRGNWTGADVTDTAAVSSQQEIDKATLVREYGFVKRRQGDRQRLNALAVQYAAKYGGSAALAGDSGVSAAEFADGASALSTSKVLALSQYAQQKNYWCGPATAYMLMKYKGVTTSRYASAPWQLSQTAFSADLYLKTETQGATRWDLKVMAPALNHWWENAANGFYVQVPYQDPTWYNGVIAYAADYGMGAAPSTVEYADGYHYNGHPSSKTIGHWLVGYGYANSGGTAYMADPATSVWSTVSPKFTYASSTFGSRFLSAHGVVF